MPLHTARPQTFITKLISFAGFALLLLLPSNTRADEIAIWNFNDSNFTVDHGSGTLTTNFTPANLLFTLAGTTINARNGDPAGQSLTLQGGTSNINNGRHLTFAVNTAGHTNIVISFAIQTTSTGFFSNQLQYSLDGVTFQNFGATIVPPAGFALFSFDLSSIAGLNNNPNAAFRIVFDGSTTSIGNNRLDNVVIEGDGDGFAVPEPASVVLLSLGLGGAVAKRARRRMNRSTVPKQ